MKQVICIDQDGFEDQLTEKTTYPVLESKNVSVLILNDKNQERWYGQLKFKVSA